MTSLTFCSVQSNPCACVFQDLDLSLEIVHQQLAANVLYSTCEIIATKVSFDKILNTYGVSWLSTHNANTIPKSSTRVLQHS